MCPYHCKHFENLIAVNLILHFLRFVIEVIFSANKPAICFIGIPVIHGALLYGPSGSGKTVIAQHVVRECGYHSVYVHGAEVWSKLVIYMNLLFLHI